MAHKKSYSRYFVILQEDEKGCALASDKQPSGYAKIEVKNEKLKISYYVQNLKRQDNPYYMGLICNKKGVNKLINIGVLNIDDNGRADVSYEFNVDSIGETGIAGDKIGGAAIFKRSKDDNIIPMSGFLSTDKPKDWKSYPVEEVKVGKDEPESNRKDEIEDNKDVEKDKATISEDILQDLKVTNKDKVRTEEALEEKHKDKLEDIPVKKEENIEQIKQHGKKIRNYEEKTIEDVSIKDTEGKQNKDTNEVKFEDKNIKVDVAKADFEDKEKPEHRVDYEYDFEEYEDNIEKIKQDKEELIEDRINTLDNINKYEEEQVREEIENNSEVILEEGDQEELQQERNKKKCKSEQEDKHNEDEGYSLGAMGEFFEGIVEGFEELDNLSDQIRYCRWYKVPIKSLDDLFNSSNYGRYTVIYYPMINYYPYIKKYGHYVIGYKFDRDRRLKYIVYAIPGTKDRREQPYGGKTGFVTWIPIRRNSNMGYWLMFYDFRNSITVVPMK
ncbi:hypothetical protein KQI89_10185 [Clostridium sp. MSJ-4]|uniref:Transmembrane protein n=1 Tax=Clostridium simiarum TaxID=2841506 RepID=A0ABS6F1K8_9CLOT|nr:hypothetical protein [Clostridium simiarum]MBU5592128.1 hypothetical protein [Clostridium simiarum]